jgi:hypothetical protein
MQKLLLFTLCGLLAFQTIAQRQPLRGSGNMVTFTFNDTGFTALSLKDLDGKIAVTVGQPYSVSISIDDNLRELLAVDKRNGRLTVALEGNRNNRLYVEDSHIQITISLPYLNDVIHEGNSTLTVAGINSSYLAMKNGGNGKASFSGQAEEIFAKNLSNGNIHAEGLLVKRASIQCRGNGNVRVNVSEELTATAAGNGSVFNQGAAPFGSGSVSRGNGRLVMTGNQ